MNTLLALAERTEAIIRDYQQRMNGRREPGVGTRGAAERRGGPEPWARPAASAKKAPPGTCARETNHLGSHQPHPTAEQKRRVARELRAQGYGEIDVRRPIGSDGVTAGPVAAYLDALHASGGRSVLMWIDSVGGDVVEGLGIVRALKRFQAMGGTVIAFVGDQVGAMSMGAVVTSAATYIVSAAGASYFYHPASYFGDGRDGDRDERTHTLDRSIHDMLAHGTLLSSENFCFVSEVETMATAAQALAAGVIDEIGGTWHARTYAAAAGRGESFGDPKSVRQYMLGTLSG
jgi:ATP-dependent protease ClpP protease subunit